MCLFCWTQRKIFWRKFVTRLFWGTIDFHSKKKNTMEVNGAPELLCFPHSSEYIPLCSAEQRHSYRFRTTWGRVNDDRIFIFGWTIPLMALFTENLWIMYSSSEQIWRNMHHILCGEWVPSKWVQTADKNITIIHKKSSPSVNVLWSQKLLACKKQIHP